MKLAKGIKFMLCGAVAWSFAGGALAQGAADYPNRTIRQVIPFAPGGASDFVGRIIAIPLSKLLGQQIISDNRPGAAGNIGMEFAARAAPDGYTLYQGNVGTLTINPNIYKVLTTKPLQDFAPVTQVVDVPGSLIAHPSLPVKNVKELVALAKRRPGELNFGSPGAGSANRMEMEGLILEAKIKMVHIPYKGGAGPAVIGLISGETQLMFTTLSSSINFIKNGKVRGLAVVAPERVEAVRNIPTMAEQGFPSMTVGSWQGLLAPAGTPKPIIDKLYAAITKVMAMPEVKDRLTSGGVSVVTSKSPQEFQDFMKRDSERWAKIVKATGITVD
jgi:tripartite-type tricarboxylate transporter receptor subunit TctC